MTTNKKVLLVKKVVKLYRDTFKVKKRVKTVTSKQLYKLASYYNWKSILLEWDAFNKFRNSINRLNFEELKKVENEIKNYDIKGISDITLINIAIAYEEWLLKKYTKIYTRNYKNMKLANIFDLLSDEYNWLPTNYPLLNKPLKDIKLIDLKDTTILIDIQKVMNL